MKRRKKKHYAPNPISSPVGWIALTAAAGGLIYAGLTRKEGQDLSGPARYAALGSIPLLGIGLWLLATPATPTGQLHRGR